MYFYWNFILKINNYTNTHECNSSEYVANGERIWIKLDSFFKNVDLEKIEVNVSNNKQLTYKIDSINKLKFYIDSKISVTDTLTISLKNKIYKIYDFKNGGQMSKAGQDRGNFHCGILNAKINHITYNFYGYNQLYLGKDY